MVPSSGWTCIYSSAPSFHSNTWHLPPSTFLRSSPDIPRSLAQVDPRPAPGLSYPPDFDILIEVLRGRIFSRPPLHIVTMTFKTRRNRRDTNGASMSDHLTWTRFRARLPRGSNPHCTFCANQVGVRVESHGQRELERDRDETISDAGRRNGDPSIRTRCSELSSAFPRSPDRFLPNCQTRDRKPQARCAKL